MENPNQPIQRRRRSERYQQPDAAPAAPNPPAPQAQQYMPPASAYQRTPRSARTQEAAPAPRPQPVVQSPPRPRALQQTAPASAFMREDAPPPAMARPPRPAAAPAKRKTAYRTPWWITASVIGLLIGILALLAAQNMMAAYLVQQQDARRAEYQKVVDNHPISSEVIKYIKQYAAEYNLQPAFVCSIVMNESSFRTYVESEGAHARGLMQIREETAEWIAGKLNISDFHFDRMFDAETNIRFGCWYLNYLSKMFRGDPILVACAYHAGQSNVTAWLSNRSYSADGLTIPLDKIPMDDSKTYAGRVTRDYGIYDALYFHVFNEETDGDAVAQSVFAQLPSFR